VLIPALILLSMGASSWAVEPYLPRQTDPVLEPWRWQSFPELKGQGLRCLAEGADGHMWFGVEDGVRRYDGVHWTAYTAADGLADMPVNALCGARDGRVYAGTDKGVYRFDEGRWDRAFPVEGELPWPVDQITETADGSVWAATAWGALHLDGDGQTRLHTTEAMAASLRQLEPSLMPRLSVSVVPDEVVPPPSWGEGLGIGVAQGSFTGARRGGEPMTIWAIAPGGPGEAAGLQLGDGILAIGREQADLLHLTMARPPGTPVALRIKRRDQPNPFEVTVVQGNPEGGIRNFGLSTVYGDQEGRLWFGFSWGGEILCYDRRDQAGALRGWSLYAAEDGLEPGSRPRIMQTRDGSIWVVTTDGARGAYRFDGQRWASVRLADMGGNDHNPVILETGDGVLWVGGLGGRLHALRDGHWTVYEPATAPVPHTRIIDLVEASDGSLWIAGLGQEAVRLDYGIDRWATHEGLRLHVEAPDGSLWFTTRDSGVVHGDGEHWLLHREQDGLMDLPGAVVATREGGIWATGTHREQAAIARLNTVPGEDGNAWSRRLFPHISTRLDPNAILQAADGSLWLSAMGVLEGQVGGILQYADGEWRHYTGAEAVLHAYDIVQTPDGLLWFGGPSLSRYDGNTWAAVTHPDGPSSWVHDMCVTGGGDLWVATRTDGVYRFDGERWDRYGMEEGLADNQVDAVMEAPDGGMWAATAGGYSRFDGHAWVTHAIAPGLRSAGIRGGLRQARDGALWLSLSGRTLRFVPGVIPPETEIDLSLEEVSRPGNTILSWSGADPWHDTPSSDLRFSWRLDDGPWSPFATATNQPFVGLSSGRHRFEVKARDRDFNEDPTPAAAQFTVVQPVWKQAWFLATLAVLFGLIGAQTVRVMWRDRQLRATNEALRSEIAERQRAQGQHHARYLVREQVWAMTSAEGIEGVLEAVGQNLRTLGVPFDYCSANIVDPSMVAPPAVYGVDQQGRWTKRKAIGTETILELWKQQRPVYRRDIRTEDPYGESARFPHIRAIVDVPFSHGTLGVSSTKAEAFSDRDLDVLSDMARLLSEGFRRMGDLQSLEQRNRDLEREVAERRRAEDQLRVSLDEKVVLLKEIHHRVKNNLQVVSSLLSLQSSYIDDAATRESLRDTRARVESMALVHEKLYESGDLARIDFGEYIRTLAGHMLRSYERIPRLRIEARNIVVDADTVIPCGLIVNELVSNSMKYAFPDGEPGEIHIELRQESDQQVVLRIGDDGVGFPPDLDFRHTESLGMQLLVDLTKQLQGTVDMRRDRGTSFEIKLPLGT